MSVLLRSLLVLSLVMCLFSSCEPKNQKEMPEIYSTLTEKDTDSIVCSEQNPPLQRTTVSLQDANILISFADDSLVYKDFIINNEFISTTFSQESNRTFSLLYEFKKISTKERYTFVFSSIGVFLIAKEHVQYTKAGLQLYKLYSNQLNLMHTSLADLLHFGATLKENDDSKNALYGVYDANLQPIGKISYRSSKENVYQDFPYLNNAKFEITQVNNTLDQVHILQKMEAHDEAKVLLKTIINTYPSRADAWLNIADTYWMLHEKDQAEDAYLNYISLMKSQHQNRSTIAQRAYDRSKP